MSLRNSETYMRFGPSTDYPVKWIYKKKRLPVKVVASFEQWRKIEDPFGEEGWVHGALLSGRDTALVVSRNPYVLVREEAETEAMPILRLEPGVIVDIQECGDIYCEISMAGYEGYLKKNLLWGIE